MQQFIQLVDQIPVTCQKLWKSTRCNDVIPEFALDEGWSQKENPESVWFYRLFSAQR
jgi:hypothetical protein